MTTVADVRDAFVAYPSPAGTVMALRGLNLRVAAGERLLIQGPNGSGKSTMLRLLTGEQAVTAGTVQVAGTDLTRLPGTARRRWRRASVGMVDQHARRALLPEWRVTTNVALQLRLGGLPRRAALRRAAETLDRLGLGHLGDRSVTTLSGGEAQRVAICAALAHDPALILADEPTGELDEQAARQVYQLLADAGRSHGAALILVSHDRRAGDLVDRVVRMRDGRLAEQWRPASGQGESQVVDDRGWLRLPAGLLPPSGPETVGRPSITLRATAMPDGDVRLTPDLDSLQPSRPVGPVSAGMRPTTDFRPTPVAVLPPPVSGSASPPPILRLTAVGVAFGARTLLSQVDLAIRAGDCIVLRGASGSGKSTLLGLAAGLTDPTSGTVRVAGTDWTELDRTARAELRRGHVAVSVQSTILAEALTVRENLRFAAALRGRSPDEGDPVAADLGLTALLDQPVRLLSGGERQRVAVARCLVSGAELMVLDEPTSQQDEASAAAVARAVRTATDGGRAVLAASHDPLFLAVAGSVLDMPTWAPRPADQQPADPRPADQPPR